MTTLYIGGEHDILRIDINLDTPSDGKVTARAQVGAMPSFLAFAPQSKLLFAAVEGADEVAALRLGPGGPSPIGHVSCPGGPAYISVDASERWLFAASYGSGETRVYPILPSGELGPEAHCLTTGQYTHCALLTPNQTSLFAVSKGTDRILSLPFDPSTGALGEIAVTEAQTGSGPRHLRFNRAGDRAYVAGENDCSLSVFSHTSGKLSPLVVVPTLPRPMEGGDSGADVHLSPDDRFIYVSNRGHDSIAIFEPTAGGVRLCGHQSVGGKIPRNFCLVGSDALIVAGQESQTLDCFRRDPETGTLTPLGSLALDQRAFWVGLSPQL